MLRRPRRSQCVAARRASTAIRASLQRGKGALFLMRASARDMKSGVRVQDMPQQYANAAR